MDAEPLQHRALDVRLTGSFDGLLAGVAFLATQSFQFLDGRGLSNVFPENCDVFGEAFDQAIAFGERGATLEEQARPTDLQFIEERIERPANPEIFFYVLLIGAEPVGSAEKRSRRSRMADDTDGVRRESEVCCKKGPDSVIGRQHGCSGAVIWLPRCGWASGVGFGGRCGPWMRMRKTCASAPGE
jgi:hypothetical protein